jgi:hypothetical protein
VAGFVLDGHAGRLWDLTKSDGTVYRLTLDADGDLDCDCPDAVYRGSRIPGQVCKYGQALTAAYSDLDRYDRLAAFLTEPVAVPAGEELPF